MDENSKPDSYFVELIQFLPVLLEFGDRKLYDTAKFEEHYPELVDQFLIRYEDWEETYYNAIDNLQPFPKNDHFFQYIDEDLYSMLKYNVPFDFLENFDNLNLEELFKEFIDEFKDIYKGINALLDELEERVAEYGAFDISPLVLNLYFPQKSIDISAMKSLQENIKSGKFKEFSKSFTIKHSEEIRDSFVRSSPDIVPILDSRILVCERNLFGDEGPKMNFYDFLYREFQQSIDTEDQPDYNLKIMANLFPLLYYEVIKEETVAEILPLFKPSTARLIKNLSYVNSKNQLDFLQKKSSEDEYKFVISFLEAELNWQIFLGGNPELAIAYYLTQFIDPAVDADIVDDILSPIYNRQKSRE